MFNAGYNVQTRQDPKKGSPRRKNWYKSNMEEVLCSVCGLRIHGHAQYSKHIKGSKHMKQVKEIGSVEEVSKMPFITLDKDTGIYRCTYCGISLNSAAVVVMHVKGLRHKQNVDNPGGGPEPSAGGATCSVPTTVADTATQQNGTSTYKEANPTQLTGPHAIIPNARTFESAETPRTHPSNYAATFHTNSLPVHFGDSGQPLQKRFMNDSLYSGLNYTFLSKYTNRPLYPLPLNTKSSSCGVQPVPSDKHHVFECNLCNVTTNSEVQLQQHLTSYKHRGNLLDKGPVETPWVIKPVSDDLMCSICNVSVNSQTQMTAHLQSPRHIKRAFPALRFAPYIKKNFISGGELTGQCGTPNR